VRSRLIVLGCAAILCTARSGFVAAQDLPGFDLWTPDQLVDAGSVMATYGNTHRVQVQIRDRSGTGELHTNESNLLVIQSGEATLLVGGGLINAREIQPNEFSGSSVRGGVEKKLTPGAIVHIPADMPYQMLLEPGKKITYFELKIVEAASSADDSAVSTGSIRPRKRK
jgi:hypothetical protein